MMALDPELLALLCCPGCRGPLVEEEALLVCGACRVAYPVREGSPSFLPEDVRSISEAR